MTKQYRAAIRMLESMEHKSHWGLQCQCEAERGLHTELRAGRRMGNRRPAAGGQQCHPES